MKAEGVGTLEGSRFCPCPVFTHILEPPVYQVGVSEQAAPANVPRFGLTLLCFIVSNDVNRRWVVGTSGNVRGSRLLAHADLVNAGVSRMCVKTGHGQKRLPSKESRRGSAISEPPQRRSLWFAYRAR
jgi:hypothetical protein